MKSNWYSFEEGATIGTVGSEAGNIIYDEEHVDGARISLEENSSVSSFTITLGVYGVFFHTIFCETIDEGRTKIEILKTKIEILLHHMSIIEKERTVKWRSDYNNHLDSLLEQR